MYTFAYIALTCAAVFSGFTFLLEIQDRIERQECLEWREQAQKLPAFYLTQWQSEQCNYHGVYVAAPVE